jgi:hypothetical protein
MFVEISQFLFRKKKDKEAVDLLMVEVTPGFRAGVAAAVVGLGVGGGVVATSTKFSLVIYLYLTFLICIVTCILVLNCDLRKRFLKTYLDKSLDNQ